MSRGISRKEAVNTVTLGYLEPTIRKFPEELAEITRELITDKMKG
jgi:Fe-S cluster assembly scaffold protein SufB